MKKLSISLKTDAWNDESKIKNAFIILLGLNVTGSAAYILNLKVFGIGLIALATFLGFVMMKSYDKKNEDGAQNDKGIESKDKA